ncbi:MAG: DEAD/DEAH box helicase [Verrucomicrobiota bacterium]
MNVDDLFESAPPVRPAESAGFSDLGLSPHGLLLLTPVPVNSPWQDAAAARRLETALGKSPAHGLLHLATQELNTVLPVAATWWREFGRNYFTRLCHTPGLEQARDIVPLPPPSDSELLAWMDTAPLMTGGEYLNPDGLVAFWTGLDELARGEMLRHKEGAAAWLREQHPLWRMVGRVTFHLAENKNHPTHPFAFMASYASRLSNQARVQHLPLGRALQEYAGTQNKPALLNLLSPIQKASEKSALAKELVESGRIFKPLPWSPAEAYRFLKDAALFEASGVIVRLPDWWKGGRPARPQVSVRVGESKGAGLGTKTLLDFSASLTLEGEPLTEKEWQELMKASEGLAFVRGKWVEVNPEKLQAALAHWKKVESMARNDGLTFFEGMRLLAGFRPGENATAAAQNTVADTEWTGIQAGQWLDTVLKELRDPTRIPAAGTIPGLHAELRPYQATGVNWLWFISRLGLGGCLADDMGLGKTIQVLALLLKRKAEFVEARLPSLLVVPASLLANWRAEILRFAPSLKFCILHPSEDASLSLAASRQFELVITTYGMLNRQEDMLKEKWDLAILDEAQAIKNPGTKQTRAVKAIQAVSRFALTGTPVENRAADLWSIFDFLNPGLLGNASAFTQFIRTQEKAGRPDYTPVRTVTHPYLLRRLKTDKRVISDLPEKTEVRAWCSLTKPQAALYAQSVQTLAEAIENTGGIQRKGLVLAAIMRFKQICNHPSQWLGDGGYSPEASGKFARVRELAEEIAARQEKALIFTQFREITDPLAEFLAGVFGRPGLVLHGGTAVAQRRKLVEAFQRDDGPPFFLLTVKAGGAGLNLTQAAHVIHFDRWWNPAVENQATDRAFRIGQKRNVLVHKFVCRGTIEERIDQLIEDKKSLSNELLEGGGERMLTEMNNDELMRFVALDLRRATEA